MEVVFRQSIKSSLFIYVIVINRLFLLPYYLTLEQLELIDVIIIIFLIYSKLALLGVEGFSQNFCSVFGNNDV